jgi:hypothetical protein
MTVAKSTSRHPAGGPMTLAIDWPHEGGEFPEIRPHDRGDRHERQPRMRRQYGGRPAEVVVVDLQK